MDRELKCMMCNIAGLRRREGLSLGEMARQLGIGKNTLVRLEQGKLPPGLSVTVLFRIQAQFGVTPKELFSKRLFP